MTDELLPHTQRLLAFHRDAMAAAAEGDSAMMRASLAFERELFQFDLEIQLLDREHAMAAAAAEGKRR